MVTLAGPLGRSPLLFTVQVNSLVGPLGCPTFARPRSRSVVVAANAADNRPRPFNSMPVSPLLAACTNRRAAVATLVVGVNET